MVDNNKAVAEYVIPLVTTTTKGTNKTSNEMVRNAELLKYCRSSQY